MTKNFYINVFQKGNNILVNEYRDGVRIFEKYHFSPSLYFLSKDNNISTPYKTINGNPLIKKTYDSINDFYRDYENYKGISNSIIYGTTSHKMQWINENYNNEIDYDLNLMRIAFIDIETCCELGFPEPSIAPEPINVLTYYVSSHKKYYVLTNKDYGDVHINDDECKIIECQNERCLLEKFLELWESDYPDILTGWNTGKFDIPYIINRIIKVLGESHVKRLSPFGIVNTRNVKNERGGEDVYYNIIGISDLDYLDLYKKYSFGEKPSYSLKYITTLELGETKLDHEEFANMHLFYKENYQKFVEYNIQDVKLVIKLDEKLNFIKLAMQIAYLAKINFRECFSPVITWESLIYNHESKKGVFFEIKEKNNSNDGYPGAFVKQPIPSKYKWVVSFDLNSLYPSLIRQFNISPEKILSEPERTELLYKIKDINNDSYLQLVKLDETNGIVQNIIDKNIDTSMLKQFDVALTGAGYFFKRDSQGFMAEIMAYIYNQRRAIKKQMLKDEDTVEKLKEEIHKQCLEIVENSDNEIIKKYFIHYGKAVVGEVTQLALKILLNSGYGAFSSPYFQFSDLRLSRSITLSGQCAVRWMEKWLNKFLNQYFHTNDIDYVITIDTDSLYLNLETLINKVKEKNSKLTDEDCINILDKFARDIIEPQIQKGYDEFYEYTNSYENQMVMKRECLCSSGVFVAKKRYCLNVFDNEGVRYEKPKLKIKGLDVVRSSTPDSIKNDIKEIYKIILDKNEKEVQQFIKSAKKKFKELKVEQISITSSITDLDKYMTEYDKHNNIFMKGTPIHVKAAITYNNMIEKLKLEKTYQYIKSGDKIKYVFLKEPNKCFNEAIAFLNFFPKEFGLNDMIDYNKTFERVFIGPVKNIMEPINWNWEEVNTLDDLFC